MGNQNGQKDPLAGMAVLHVGWDEKTKTVRIACNMGEFGHWAFIEGVLEMAVKVAGDAKRMAQLQAMQQQQQAAVQQQIMAAEQEQKIKNRLIH